MAQKSMIRFHYAFHFFMYYAAWFVGLELAARGKGLLAALIILILTAVQILWQFKVRKRTAGIFYLIFLFTLTGFVVDSIFVRSGLIYFSSNFFAPNFTAPWMITVWVSFAVLFYSLLNNFFSRYLLLSVLAFFGFAFAYTGGVKMGAANFPHGYLTALIVGGVWAFCLPLCMYIYNRRIQ
jgi:hypothetical protein